MLGVFRKRWKPKNRVTKSENGDNSLLSCSNEYSEPINAYVLPDTHLNKLCSARRNMFPVCDNNAAHYSVAYETLKPSASAQSTPDKGSPAAGGYGKPEAVPPPVGGVPAKTATVGGASATAPNICIEGGRIEFVKPPADCGDEKQDCLKEYLEAKIVQLESELVAERKITQRERVVNSSLQKQLSRREWLQRDVDRERRLRLDTEARLKGSSSEADRCRAKLSALQKDFTKMEETVRTLLQYKSKFEQLKQDRHSVANSYENQILQLQNAITKLKIENETLKKQINTLEATGISQVQKALVERLRILEHEKNRIEREGEQQRKQYERCLDEVAKQVVKAVLSQKGLREEISSLQHRVKELETGNCALSALLVQRLGQKISYSPTTMPVVDSRSVMFDIHRSPSMKMAIERPASCDLTKGLKRLKNDGWQTTVSYHRPQSLNLEICCSHSAEESTKCDRVLGDETPESGNRDEGYSTMSSDVQGTAEPPSTKGLEDVKEANENESTALMESSPCSRAPNSEDTDVIFVPLGLSFSFINPRHSYPPLRCLSAVPARHVMRSYSDSHLFLRLTATAAGGGGGEDEDGTSWYSGGELWDIDYVQHWLRLDETRAAIQQRMEYDAAELEDWTMADDGAVWRRTTVSAATEDGRQRSLPCIEEDDGTSTAGGRGGGGGGDDDEDDDDPWHQFHHRRRRPQQQQQQQQHRHQHRNHHHRPAAPQPSASSSSPPPSSTSSWSSADEYAAADDSPPSRKRSSASSCCSDSAADLLLLPPPDRPIAGTDFTRDFYRLVKFESSKSLASCASSRSEYRPRAAVDAQQPDRELALQTVLDFIAEQQQYCLSRQAEIKPVPSADDEDEADRRPVSPPPPPPLPSTPPPPLHRQRTCDSNSCSDNLLNSKDSGLWGSDVEIECLPEDGYELHRCGGGSGTAASTPRSTLLRTVPEEEDDDDDDDDCNAPPSPAASTSPQPPSTGAGRSSSACTADTAIAAAAWTATSSKDLIDQLNRLADVRSPAAADRDGPDDCDERRLRRPSAASLDEACCCPTGWVHVERDIDFADPKERANLLDVMLASSRSSSSSSGATADDDDDGSSGDGCAGYGSVGEEPDGGHDTADDVDSDCSDDARDRRPTVERPEPTGSHATNEESYNRLHKLHRVRRQKKASAVREGFGVLRAPTAGLRQSIVGRSDFFVRFGDKEREAMANFDFLDDLSATSPGSADSACDRPPSPPPATRGTKCYLYTCSPPPPLPSTSGRRTRTSSPLLPRDGRRQRRRRYSGLSLSDSCGDSD